MKYKFGKTFYRIFALALIALIAIPFAAFADTISNNVVAGGNDTITAGNSTTINFQINATSTPAGDLSGCNANGSNRATLTVNVPSGVTATPPSISGIAGCGNPLPVTFSSNTPNNYNITVSMGGGRSGSQWDVTGAAFTLHVLSSDSTKPDLHLPASPVIAEATGQSGAAVSYSASATDVDDPVTSFSCSPSSGSTFALGNTTVNCSATDSHGNSSSGSFTVKVQDTTGPTFSGALSHMDVEAQSSSGATVTWINPTANDLVDGTRTVSCSPSSGSTFALGTTQVDCSASDTSGNTSHNTFSVTVADNTAPALIVPTSLDPVEATGPSGASVSFTVSANDLVDGNRPVSCAIGSASGPSVQSGDVFPLGTTTVYCSASDTSDHGVTQHFDVTVQDTTAPVIALHGNELAEATGPNGAVVNYTKPATTDAVDGTGMAACSPSPGTFPIGTTAVTCNAQDAAGNMATPVTFYVTVQDTTPPSVSVPADMTVEATGLSGATVTFSASAQDIVDGNITEVDCLPTSGSVFGLGTTTVTCSAHDSHNNIGSNTFDVTVRDTTPPTVTAPADITAEATGPSGAAVTYSGASATDIVDGPLMPSCNPASGATFPLGTTTVDCSATDGHGNTGNASFTITVQDTTAPTIDSHSDETAQATSAAGALVSYTSPATHDAVSGNGTASCTPASGSQFALGNTTVTCNASDAAGNAATSTSFVVHVVDTTAPVIATHGDVTAEATSANGALVSYTAPATSDAVDGAGTATCSPASGTQFALGNTTVTCNASDAAGNPATPTSFVVHVVDTTAPVIAPHGSVTAEATSASGAVVNYTSPATSDAVDGPGTATCMPASGTQFALGNTTVTCNASDAAGNAATSTSFVVHVVDTTAPVIAPHADVSAAATSASGAVVNYTSPATSDAVDGPGTATCTPASGSQFAPGDTTVTCNASDAAGNAATPTSFKIHVTYQLKGFYQPVDMNGVYNTVKGGSTVPLKFEVFAGSTELTDVSAVSSLKVVVASCSSSATTDEIEVLSSGSTVLRYDATGGQFIYNWKTPTGAGCYKVTVTTADGSTISALFQTRK